MTCNYNNKMTCSILTMKKMSMSSPVLKWKLIRFSELKENFREKKRKDKKVHYTPELSSKEEHELKE